MLDRLEDLVCDVVDRVLKSPYGQIVYELNPVSHLYFIKTVLCIVPQKIPSLFHVIEILSFIF